MATWRQLAEDNRDSLRTLAAETCRRSYLSRAYYAAYSLLTHHLLQAGADFGKTRAGSARANPAHRDMKRLIRRYLRPLWGRDRADEVSRCVGLLYTRRLEADYMPAQAIGKAETISASRELKKLFLFVEGI